MNYTEFRNKMYPLACFNINQVYAWDPGFNRNNLPRWVAKGLLIRLRQGLYTFPEYKGKADFPYYFANRMYNPSYISIHTALAFYGIIPETVVQITSITSLKTAFFSNSFGDYSYKTVQDDLMFGYDLRPVNDEQMVAFATPEKALLDLLYIYPFYNTMKEIEELRLDEDFLQEDLKKEVLTEYLIRFKNKALEKRARLLLDSYRL